jgi:hypothetical protein
MLSSVWKSACSLVTFILSLGPLAAKTSLLASAFSSHETHRRPTTAARRARTRFILGAISSRALSLAPPPPSLWILLCYFRSEIRNLLRTENSFSNQHTRFRAIAKPFNYQEVKKAYYYLSNLQ